MALFPLLVLVFSVPGIISAPVKKAKGRSFVEAVDNESDNDIIKYIQSIPLINFDGDVLLLQFPDRIKGKTDYRHMNPQMTNQIVYDRNSLDTDKDVVILKTSEDHIKSRADKRVFVVLRRNLLLGNKQIYYVSYLYIQPALPNQKEIHTFGKKKVTVEWDFWDHRDANDDEKSQLESTFDCSSTIFIPCRSNETIGFPLLGKGRTSTAVDGAARRKSVERTSNRTLIVDGGDPDKLMDFFGDLEMRLEKGFQSEAGATGRKAQGRAFGRAFGPPKPQKPKQGENAEGAADEPPKPAQENSAQKPKKGGPPGPGPPHGPPPGPPPGKNKFKNAMQKFIEKGMGLVKSFNGLYGGIGTPEAKTDAVLQSLLGMDNLDDLAADLSDAEIDELNEQMKLSSSGGMGGFINAEEDAELEEQEGTTEKTNEAPQGRSLASNNKGNSGSSNVPEYQREEGPYVKYGWMSDVDAQAARRFPFIGFGACRLSKVTLSDFDRADKPVDVIRLYQTALRTHCISKDTKLYEQLFSDGIIVMESDKSFQINISASLMTEEKLQHHQRIELFRALEMGIFSKVYMEELKDPSRPLAPDTAEISKTVFTLGKMYLRGLSMKHQFPKKQCIKMLRNCVKTLITAMNKLLEDETFVAPEDKETNFNDRVYLMGLTQFIMHGISIEMHGKDVITSFHTFFVKNRELLEDKTVAYY